MKAEFGKGSNVWVVPGLVAMMLLGRVPMPAQEKTPPAPKVPSSTLKLPKPVKAGEIRGRASLPENAKTGFALDLAGKVVPGNWDVKGKVSSVEAERIMFVSERGDSGSLVFRMPKGMKLSIAQNDPVRIRRTMKGTEGNLGHEVLLESGAKMVAAAGRLYGSGPLTATIASGVSVEQGKGQYKLLAASEYDTTYQVPLTLKAGGKTTILEPTGSKEATIGGRGQMVNVVESIRVVPSKKHESTSEGAGYTLEYVIASK
jgi:hypothetical protein